MSNPIQKLVTIEEKGGNDEPRRRGRPVVKRRSDKHTAGRGGEDHKETKAAEFSYSEKVEMNRKKRLERKEQQKHQLSKKLASVEGMSVSEAITELAPHVADDQPTPKVVEEETKWSPVVRLKCTTGRALSNHSSRVMSMSEEQVYIVRIPTLFDDAHFTEDTEVSNNSTKEVRLYKILVNELLSFCVTLKSDRPLEISSILVAKCAELMNDVDCDLEAHVKNKLYAPLVAMDYYFNKVLPIRTAYSREYNNMVFQREHVVDDFKYPGWRSWFRSWIPRWRRRITHSKKHYELADDSLEEAINFPKRTKRLIMRTMKWLMYLIWLFIIVSFICYVPVANAISNKEMHAYNGNPCMELDLPIPDVVKKGSRISQTRSIGKPLKNVVTAGGFISGLYEPVVYPNTLVNQRTALYARVLCQTPEPDLEFLQMHNDFIMSNFDSFLGVGVSEIMSFEQYLKGSNASSSVKTVLAQTHAKLTAMHINHDSKLSKRQLKRWTSRKSFVKVECNSYQTPLGLKKKAPRLIQGAQPEFICLVGPFIATVQILVKRKWGLNNNILFTSSHSSSEVAAFISNVPNNYDTVEDDVSAWDSSIHEMLCKLELQMAKRMGAPRAVLDLMRANVSTHGRTDCFAYSVPGTRKSGDPYTSLFNSVLNASTHLFLYSFYRQLNFEESFKRMKMVVQGDDNLLRFEHADIPWQAGMARLGFKAQAIPRQGLDNAEFCSCVYVAEPQPNFVPKLGKLLSKMCYFINPPPRIPIKSLVRGVALANSLTINSIPLRLICQRLLALTTGFEEVMPRQFEWQMKRSVVGTLCFTETVRYHWDSTLNTALSSRLSDMSLGSEYPELVQLLIIDRDVSGPQSLYNVVIPEGKKIYDDYQRLLFVRKLASIKENKHLTDEPNQASTAGLITNTGLDWTRANDPIVTITPTNNSKAPTTAAKEKNCRTSTVDTVQLATPSKRGNQRTQRVYRHRENLPCLCSECKKKAVPVNTEDNFPALESKGTKLMYSVSKQSIIRVPQNTPPHSRLIGIELNPGPNIRNPGSLCSIESTDIPSPRLVGIELNPGPPKSKFLGLPGIRTDIAEAAALLGSALAGPRKTVKKKQKKKHRLPRSSLPSSRQIAAPLMVGFPSRATVPGVTNHIISLPFTGMDITAKTHEAGSTYNNSIDFSDGITSTAYGLNFQPMRILGTDSPATNRNHPSCFGYAMHNVASAFMQYRIRSLRVDFIPYSNTSTTGVLAFGALSDPSMVQAPGNLQTVGVCENNIITNFWAGASMDLTSLVRSEKWFYCRQRRSDTGDVEDERFNAPGTLIGYFENPNSFGSASYPLGLLRFSGVIEFKGISTTDLLQNSSSSSTSQLPNYASEDEIKVPDGFLLVKQRDEEKFDESELEKSVHISRAEMAKLLIKR